MSIPGYKCDFCSHFNIDHSKVKLHETSCSFNPDNKHCYTCENRIDGVYLEEGDTCSLGLSTWDCEGDCPKWIKEVRG